MSAPFWFDRAIHSYSATASVEVLAVAMALQALLLDWVREDAAEDVRTALRALLEGRARR